MPICPAAGRVRRPRRDQPRQRRGALRRHDAVARGNRHEGRQRERRRVHRQPGHPPLPARRRVLRRTSRPGTRAPPAAASGTPSFSQSSSATNVRARSLSWSSVAKLGNCGDPVEVRQRRTGSAAHRPAACRRPPCTGSSHGSAAASWRAVAAASPAWKSHGVASSASAATARGRRCASRQRQQAAHAVAGQHHRRRAARRQRPLQPPGDVVGQREAPRRLAGQPQSSSSGRTPRAASQRSIERPGARSRM